MLNCYRYLASGESMMSIMYSFRIGKATVSKLIFQCCEVLWDTLNTKVCSVCSILSKLTLGHNYDKLYFIIV